MKKKFIAALVIAMTMGVLAGCGDDGNGPSSPVSTLNPSPIMDDPEQPDPSEGSDAPNESTPEEEGVLLENGMKSGGETHTIGTRTVVDGKMQSWLTGEWKDEAIANRRNMAIMVPNNKR